MKYKILSFFLFISMGAWAQLHIKNTSDKTFYVSIGWYQDAGSNTGYMTRGWFTIAPGETVDPGLTFSSEDHFYYYAVSSDESVQFVGDKKLLVAQEGRFEIKNADQPSTKDKTQSYVWKGMKEVDVSFGDSKNRSYTLQLMTNTNVLDTTVVNDNAISGLYTVFMNNGGMNIPTHSLEISNEQNVGETTIFEYKLIWKVGQSDKELKGSAMSGFDEKGEYVFKDDVNNITFKMVGKKVLVTTSNQKYKACEETYSK
jgi:uncharacterized membrane protein